MAVKSFFKWVIMRYEDWRNLEKESDRLSNAVIVRDEQIERLNKRLDAIKNGERCEGEYCKSCKHAIEGDAYEYRTATGNTICFGEYKILCALATPCPGYEREE